MSVALWLVTALALIPATLFVINLRLYRVLPIARRRTSVSVLIPARDEAGVIEGAVQSVLSNKDVDLEVIVLDDQSTDGTSGIVRRLGAADARVRCEPAPLLPDGWCGKQHACAVLASLARFETLCFMDADVKLANDALGRMSTFLYESGADLVSGFPHERTETWLEKLLLPLIHFVLLGFLPIARMRRSVSPAYAAGCGQLIMVSRAGYDKAGGHRAIAASLHDGLNLPKAFRQAELSTDLFDATDIADCRMYTGARQVWSGLSKNAVEGIAAPTRILPFTVLLLVGQVLPFAFLFAGIRTMLPAVVLAWLPRFLGALRFRQSWLGALLHPFGVVVLLAIQWVALTRHWLGYSPSWKGRICLQAERNS